MTRDEWAGPPVLVLRLRLGEKEEILDGRKRLQEWFSRGASGKPPTQTATNHLDALRVLILNGHHVRAADYALKRCPEYLDRNSEPLHRLLQLHHNKLKPMLRQLKDPRQRHKRPRRALEVVKRVRAIRMKMLEGDNVTLADIERALGEFND